MKVEFWTIGKTKEAFLVEGCGVYEKRLKHYLPFSAKEFSDIKNRKNLSVNLIKEQEGTMILKELKSDDFLVLLDEKGKSYTSETFAGYLEKVLGFSNRKLIFLVGGAYGFSEKMYQRANAKVALSAMTFSHQMVRLFFLEQLYRGMTILKNEPYHHA